MGKPKGLCRLRGREHAVTLPTATREKRQPRILRAPERLKCDSNNGKGPDHPGLTASLESTLSASLENGLKESIGTDSEGTGGCMNPEEVGTEVGVRENPPTGTCTVRDGRGDWVDSKEGIGSSASQRKRRERKKSGRDGKK